MVVWQVSTWGFVPQLRSYTVLRETPKTYEVTDASVSVVSSRRFRKDEVFTDEAKAQQVLREVLAQYLAAAQKRVDELQAALDAL